jgi:hypothetical protein
VFACVFVFLALRSSPCVFVLSHSLLPLFHCALRSCLVSRS